MTNNYFKVFNAKRKSNELDLHWRGPHHGTFFPFDDRSRMSVVCAYNLALREKDLLESRVVGLARHAAGVEEGDEWAEPETFFKIAVWRPGIHFVGPWSYLECIRDRELQELPSFHRDEWRKRAPSKT